MQVYLPIAQISVDVFVLLAMGAAVGFISSLFGVGGGFLITPLLIFIGIPPPVAVATQINQVVGAAVSGTVAHWRRGNIDFTMGWVLMVGTILGSTVGVTLFAMLQRAGQIDLVIVLMYIVFLGGIGSLMLVESLRALLRQRRAPGARFKLHQHNWLHGLPFKMRFRKSRLYISALLPLVLGFVTGVLIAMMGVGGGFFLVPSKIYLLGMPTTLAVGTSLFQTIFVAAYSTLLQAVQTQTVDILLAIVLLVGGLLGTQIGARIGPRLHGDQLRILLALLIVGVWLKLVIGATVTPDDLYSLQVVVPS
ncbi:MAG TPA: sulfite exporter TauE/SafE family protein [Alphaproteobacteria bacterium]|jgi:uncharacterized membrane protein YfcA|nr:sulfite exporter TauE/SafE family protein [Alphaproteobacteria bacterium]